MSANLNTQWVVLTGAPSSGKTTLIHALKGKGYRVVSDVARRVIEENKSSANLKEQAALQEVIVDTFLSVTSDLDANSLVFFDSGMPDNIAFQKMLGIEVEGCQEYCQTTRYAKVFICESLEFKSDGVRDSDLYWQSHIKKNIIQVYESFEYDLISIPVDTVENRLDFLLSNVGIENDYTD